MESDLWRGFIAVAEHRSFTAAAESLPVSQSGLSQQIRRLESLLGVSLFERNTREVRLSECGNEIVQAARAFLRAEEDLLDRVRGWREEDAGKQVLTAFVVESSVGHLLIDIIERARTLIDGLRVEVEEIALAEQNDVLASALDSAVLIARPPLSSELRSARRTVLAEDPLCLVVGADHDIPDEVSLDAALAVDRRALPWLPQEWLDWSPLLRRAPDSDGDVVVARNFRNALQSVAVDGRACVAPTSIARHAIIEGVTRIVHVADAPLGTIELVSRSAERLVAEFHTAAAGIRLDLGFDDSERSSSAASQ